MTKGDIFYVCGECPEILTATDPGEALYDYVNDSFIESLEILELESPVKLYTYTRMKNTVPINADHILEDLLERFDEEYGSSYVDDWGKPTEGMRKAAAEFVAKVRAEYVPWACEVSETVEVDLVAWVKKEMPEFYAELQEKGGSSE
jgi:hypothetical protein